MDGTNPVIRAEIPSGTKTVVLEGSTPDDSQAWRPRSVARPEWNETAVEFRPEGLLANEFFRVRIGRETSLPINAFDRRLRVTNETWVTTNSIPVASVTPQPNREFSARDPWMDPLSTPATSVSPGQQVGVGAKKSASVGGLVVALGEWGGVRVFRENGTNGVSLLHSWMPTGRPEIIVPLDNRHVALVDTDGNAGRFTRVTVYDLAPLPPVPVFAMSWAERFIDADMVGDSFILATSIPLTSTNALGRTRETRLRSFRPGSSAGLVPVADIKSDIGAALVSFGPGFLVLAETRWNSADNLLQTVGLDADGRFATNRTRFAPGAFTFPQAVLRHDRRIAVWSRAYDSHGDWTNLFQVFDISAAGNWDIRGETRLPAWAELCASAEVSGHSAFVADQKLLHVDWSLPDGPKIFGLPGIQASSSQNILVKGNRLLVRQDNAPDGRCLWHWFSLDGGQGPALLDSVGIPLPAGRTVVDGYSTPGQIVVEPGRLWLPVVVESPDLDEFPMILGVPAFIESGRLSLGSPLEAECFFGASRILAGTGDIVLGSFAPPASLVRNADDRWSIAWPGQPSEASGDIAIRGDYQLVWNGYIAQVSPAKTGAPVLHEYLLGPDGSYPHGSHLHGDRLLVWSRPSSTADEVDPKKFEVVFSEHSIARLPDIALVGRWTNAMDGLTWSLLFSKPSQLDGDRLLFAASGLSSPSRLYNWWSAPLTIPAPRLITRLSGSLWTIDGEYSPLISPYVTSHWEPDANTAASSDLLAIRWPAGAAPVIGKSLALTNPAIARDVLLTADTHAFQSRTLMEHTLVGTNALVLTGKVASVTTNVSIRTNVSSVPITTPVTNLVFSTNFAPVRQMPWPTNGTVSGGGSYILALDGSRRLWSWGDGYNGELGNGGFGTAYGPVPVISNVVQAVAGYRTALAVMEDGSLWSWGYDPHQPLNYLFPGGPPLPVFGSLFPRKVDGLPIVRSAAAGYGHQLALDSNGGVWSWGGNTYGQLGLASTNSDNIPRAVAGISNAVAVAAGFNSSAILLGDGTVLTAGRTAVGQLGRKSTNLLESAFAAVPGLSNILAISSSGYSTAALDTNGAVHVWGRIPADDGAAPSTNFWSAPQTVPLPEPAREIAFAVSHLVVRGASGRIWSWGISPPSSAFPAGGTPTLVAQLGSNSIAVAATRSHVASLGADGMVRMTGTTGPILLGDESGDTVVSNLVPGTLVSYSLVTNIGPEESYTRTVQTIIATNLLPVFSWTRKTVLDVVDFTDVGRPVLRPALDLPAPVIGVSHGGEVLYSLDDGLAATQPATPDEFGTGIRSLAYDGAELYDLGRVGVAYYPMTVTASLSISNTFWITEASSYEGRTVAVRLDATGIPRVVADIPMEAWVASRPNLVEGEDQLLGIESDYGLMVVDSKQAQPNRPLMNEPLLHQPGWRLGYTPHISRTNGWIQYRLGDAPHRIEIGR